MTGLFRLVACGRFLAELGNELIESSGAGLGLMTERDGDLTSGYTGVRLALAETTYVGNRGTGDRHGFRSADLRIR